MHVTAVTPLYLRSEEDKLASANARKMAGNRCFVSGLVYEALNWYDRY